MDEMKCEVYKAKSFPVFHSVLLSQLFHIHEEEKPIPYLWHPLINFLLISSI